MKRRSHSGAALLHSMRRIDGMVPIKSTLHGSMGVTALALLGGFAGAAHAGPEFSGWSESTATGLAGGCPIESRNGIVELVGRRRLGQATQGIEQGRRHRPPHLGPHTRTAPARTGGHDPLRDGRRAASHPARVRVSP